LYNATVDIKYIYGTLSTDFVCLFQEISYCYKYVFCRTKNSPPKKNTEEDQSRQRIRYMYIL